MIEVEGLRKFFGTVRALDGVSFAVNNGEIVGLVGLNGAGKTTTMRIIVGVLRPDSGRTLIDGHDVLRDKVEASRRVGWVPEAPTFEGGFTAKGLPGLPRRLLRDTRRRGPPSGGRAP